MASRESEALASLYRGWAARMAADPAMPIDNFRAMFEEWETVTAVPAGVTFEDEVIAGIPVRWARPEAASTGVIICLHGGGYVTGSRASHGKLFGHLARAASASALIVEYRRAPEAPYPAALDDALAVYRWALSNGFAADEIVLAGDSAGGGLCVCAALAMREQGTPLPAGIFLMSPWLDLSAAGESYEANADKDLVVSRPVIQALVPAILGEHGRIDDPLVNPIVADPTGLPPMLIQVGGHESFLDDSRLFASRVEQARGQVVLDVVADMQHVFHFLGGSAPEADAAIARAGDWLAERLQR